MSPKPKLTSGLSQYYTTRNDLVAVSLLGAYLGINLNVRW